MPSKPTTRIAEPLLGGPDGIHLASAGAGFRRGQAYIFASILGLTTFLALALQGPCLSSGYEQPSASARMCSGPLSTAFLGEFNPEDALGRSHGGMPGLSALEARFVQLLKLMTDDVSVFMTIVLIVNVIAFAALGVALLILARQRAWLIAAFASPVILFTLGSTLDPVAVALSIWAMIIFVGSSPVTIASVAVRGPPRDSRIHQPAGPAGSPRTQPDRSFVRPDDCGPRDPRMMLATVTITSALLLVIDGSAIDRVLHWMSDAVDGGSFASILVMARLGSAEAWAPVWIIASAGVIAAVAVSLFMVRRTGLDPAVAACLLIGGCLLLAPGMMPWDSLWILPFLVLAVRRWWVLIIWAVAETAFAIAIHLGDVAAIEPDKGLEPTFVALLTLLRLLALVAVVICAGENLYRRRIRGRLRIAEPPRRGESDHPVIRVQGHGNPT